jgi:hypothetical protein
MLDALSVITAVVFSIGVTIDPKFFTVVEL